MSPQGPAPSPAAHRRRPDRDRRCVGRSALRADRLSRTRTWALSRRRMVQVVALVAVALAAAVAGYSARAQPEPAELRLDVTAPPTTDAASLAISPDGRHDRVRRLCPTDCRRLWLRSLDGTDGEAAVRNRERQAAVLVSRQPVDRLHVERRAETHRRRERLRAVTDACRGRRHLEAGRHDPVRPGPGGRHLPHFRCRRRAVTSHHSREQHRERPLVSLVPSRRTALLVRGHWLGARDLRRRTRRIRTAAPPRGCPGRGVRAAGTAVLRAPAHAFRPGLRCRFVAADRQPGNGGRAGRHGPGRIERPGGVRGGRRRVPRRRS